MDSKKIGICMIGAGLRSNVTRLLFGKHSNVKLVSICDPDHKRAAERAESLGFNDVKIFSQCEEAINQPGVDWVMIFSPNTCHAGHIMAALKAGKNVFTEKPMATTIEDCEEVFKAFNNSNCQLVTGFVLRYSPIYRKVKELLDAGTIGKIISVEADENLSVELGAYIMKNWRRLRANAGPYILEKCCHDLDLLNWFIGSLPCKTASFGGLNFYVPENDYLRIEHTKADGTGPFNYYPDPNAVESPFTCDKDIVDNQVIILEYRNGVRATFHTSMSNPIPERRMYISGSEGTLVLSYGKISVRRIGEEAVRHYDLEITDGHAGGDQVIMDEFYKAMMGELPPKSTGLEGLESAVIALSIDKAQRSNTVVDIESVWKKLGH